MTEAELMFSALAELSTRQIAETTDATGLPANTKAAKAGGGIAKAGAQTAGEPNWQVSGVKAELPGTWGCERLGEAFAEETVGWMGGLWGRWREIQSLDSDDQMLCI